METALAALKDDFWRHLGWDRSALLLSLNLSAVFNTVSYSLLTQCLANAGIQGTTLQWLLSFLQNWEQMVVLGEKTSL